MPERCSWVELGVAWCPPPRPSIELPCALADLCLSKRVAALNLAQGSCWKREEDDAGDARALARRALAGGGDPRRLCRAQPCGADRRRRGPAPAAVARGRGPFARGRHLGHAFRRYAGREATLP